MTGILLMALGVTLAAVVVPRLRRSSHPFAQAVARPRGIQPTGPDGRWTRRDHLRAAGAQGVLFVSALAGALTIMGLADRWPVGSQLNVAVSLPGLAVFFFALFYLWLALRSLLRAAFTRAGATAAT